jgi:chemotaxis protein methyltransferase CheR
MINNDESREYSILGELLYKRTGQRLLANRHWRIDTALRPVMRKHSIPDINVLADLIQTDAMPELAIEIVDAMLNNETCFFRDQANFALITGPVLDALRDRRQGQKRLRIWSAACSTGQEAYSLAMGLCENAEKWRDWNIQIIANDVSETAVARARSGRFSQFEIQRGLPVTMMLKYFTQDGEDWIANEKLRRMIIFSQHNLVSNNSHLGQFDLILCRNMLMYLDETKRTSVLNSLSENLVSDGYLVLGASETVIGQTEKFVTSTEFRGLYEKSKPSQSSASLQQSQIRSANSY